MKNIVTIDFDIIMGPSIELYNSLVPRKQWEELGEIPQIRTLSADLTLYSRLTEYILKIKKQISSQHIHFLLDHEDVSFFIQPEEEVIIYNIDHHHDCGYDQHKKYDKMTCANWVYFIHEFASKVEYNWICNINSDLPCDEEDSIKTLIQNQYFIGSFNLDQLPIPDELVIVLSPQWVPPNIQPLFTLWNNLIKKEGE